ncbi:acetate uptake transporter [Serratia marcescens]|nr:acetate uptake transporter [Serratia marcescens]
MGPSNPASRGKAKKISFFIVIQIIVSGCGDHYDARALVENFDFLAIQTIYYFTSLFPLIFCYRRGLMHTNKLANPGPLGLMGFGMTTVLLNLHNAGFFPLNSAIISMGIFFGGLAQILAGLLEYKKGNTFGMTAFTAYGSFWLSLVGLLLLPRLGLAEATEAHVLGIYLALWGVFTLFMFFGTLGANRVLQFVFASLTLLFALLAVGNITGNHALLTFAGYEGIICGASAIYLAMAEVLNEQYGRTVLPIGEPAPACVATSPVTA